MRGWSGCAELWAPRAAPEALEAGLDGPGQPGLLSGREVGGPACNGGWSFVIPGVPSNPNRSLVSESSPRARGRAHGPWLLPALQRCALCPRCGRLPALILTAEHSCGAGGAARPPAVLQPCRQAVLAGRAAESGGHVKL